MSDDTLQMRRDTRARLLASSGRMELAEPTIVVDEEAFMVGRGAASKGGYRPQGIPPSEGIQHKVLWATGSYGTSPGLLVPALAAPANGDTTRGYALTGGFIRGELADSVAVDIIADGWYLADSPAPEMLFDLAFGPDRPAPVSLRPVTGRMRGTTLLSDRGVEVSYATMGANALGLNYQERLRWHFRARVHFLSAVARGRMTISGPGKVRVTGHVEWGPRLTGRGGYGASPGPVRSGASDSWQPSRAGGWAIGEQISHHHHPYRSIVAQAAQPTAAASSSTADRLAWLEGREALRDVREPGAGRDWRQWWYDMNQRMDFSWEQTGNLNQDAMSLSLRMAGPYQANTLGAITVWDGTGSGNWDPFASADIDRSVVDGPRFFTPRFVFPKQGAPKPIDNPRHWREMSYFRRDQMVCDSSVAVAHGGRVGLADRVIL